MQRGMQYRQLATLVEGLSQNRKDFLVPKDRFRVDSDKKIHIEPVGESEIVLPTNKEAFRQLTGRLEIPAAYCDRMAEHEPGLLMTTTNVWAWSSQSPERHLFRCLVDPDGEGHCRAVLSDRYKRIEHEDILRELVPVCESFDGRLESCHLSKNWMRLKYVFPALERPVKVGDIVQAGVAISNSETGYGAASVRILIYRLACDNGMVVPHAIGNSRRHHRGAMLTANADYTLVDGTQEEMFERVAFLEGMARAIEAIANPDTFHEVVGKLEDAAGRVVAGPLELACERVCKRLGISGAEAGVVLNNLIASGDHTQWGMANAITSMANSGPYQRAQKLEALGGRLAYWGDHEWARFAG